MSFYLLISLGSFFESEYTSVLKGVPTVLVSNPFSVGKVVCHILFELKFYVFLLPPKNGMWYTFSIVFYLVSGFGFKVWIF